MKAILTQALLLAGAIAKKIEQETGEKITARLDLDFSEPLPAIDSEQHVDSDVDSDGSGGTINTLEFNRLGFSLNTDRLGRVRFRDVDAYISEQFKVDPDRAARIPRWFYFPPAYSGPNESKFPSDEARELAWLNFNDRYWIGPMTGIRALFAYAYERAAIDPKRPAPASMLPWHRTALLTDTKAYDWGFADASQPLKDARKHWEDFSSAQWPTTL